MPAMSSASKFLFVVPGDTVGYMTACATWLCPSPSKCPISWMKIVNKSNWDQLGLVDQFSWLSKWKRPSVGANAWARTPPGPSKLEPSPWFPENPPIVMSAVAVLPTNRNLNLDTLAHVAKA